MTVSLNEKLKALEPARRQKVEARAEELIAEELTLRDLRRARERTQVSVARALGIKQEGVSRLEKRSDLLISTLRDYVEAMGGELSLVVEFPDRPPVHIAGLAELDETGRRRGTRSPKAGGER